MADKDLWKPENKLPDKDELYTSPSGKYSLTIQYFGTGKDTWSVTKGIVCSNDVIAEVKRNYHYFWFEWVEDHPNGKDYLLCGEDYQGYTVVDLMDGLVHNYLPESAKQGAGFCWIGVDGSEKTKLVVEGCYWAFPYEVVEYDFSNPETLPLPELSRRDLIEEDEEE